MTHILLHDVIVNKDAQKAESSLLKLSGLRKFMDRLKTEREKEDFRRHMRKYIQIWLPDCPWEVSTTNRYSIVTQEASTTARRFIKKGDTIKYLSGNLVSMTADEEQDLDLTRRDFSIVMSSRKKTPSLFLGPARFANHDCNANARLVTRGSDGMQVVAVKDIKVDQEITVSYGDNYFGEDNCECLCHTCEVKHRNGWVGDEEIESLSGTATPLIDSDMDVVRPYSLRRKRKHLPGSGSSSPSMTPETDEGPTSKRRKTCESLGRSSFRSKAAEKAIAPITIKTRKTGSTLRHEVTETELDMVSSLPLSIDVTVNETSIVKVEKEEKEDSLYSGLTVAICLPKQRRGRPSIYPEAAVVEKVIDGYVRTLPESQTISIDPLYSEDYEVKPMSTKSLLYSIPATELLPIDFSNPITPASHCQSSSRRCSSEESVFDDTRLVLSSQATTPSTTLESGLDWGLQPTIKEEDLQKDISDILSDSDLSDLPNDQDLDDTLMTVIPKSKKRKYTPKAPKSLPTIEISTSVARFPGDYIRNRSLLGESYSRWVNCRTCSACWVQPNGYYTRKECPRCERHSKLYGYRWPKTDKTGKGDEEERVMDHRTVHRFVPPDEERTVKKRGRGLLGDEVGSEGTSEREESAEESVERRKSRRATRRGSGLGL